MLRYPQSRRRHGTWAAMGTPGLLRRGRTPELRVGRPRAGRLAQRRNTGGAGAGAPAGRATADAQQDQRDADAAGRALCRVGARHAAPGRKRAKRCARRSAAPRAGCAFPRPTCWAWRCCRPCCGAMPRTTPTCASTSAIPTNGWIRSPKDWTSPFAAAFPPPASCWARACGPMSDCYAPARTTWRAWDCRANRKTWCATASSCTPARACSRTGTCAARAASSACARSRPSASALAAA